MSDSGSNQKRNSGLEDLEDYDEEVFVTDVEYLAFFEQYDDLDTEPEIAVEPESNEDDFEDIEED